MERDRPDPRPRGAAPPKSARAVEEAGGGESEGFELAEQELIEHASHGDEHNTTPIMRDAEGVTEEEAAVEEPRTGKPTRSRSPTDVRRGLTRPSRRGIGL